MSGGLAGLFPDEKTVMQRLEEWVKTIEECSAKNHAGHREIIIRPYTPRNGRSVLVICSHCSHPYERDVTGEELQSYSRMMKLEITI